jgi:hypothetical protein
MSKYPNSGTLNKNERKRDGKNDPDYEGQAEVNGVGYWLACWVKAGPNGKFFSISFKPKEARAAPAQPKSRQPGEDDEPFDDDLPF